MLGAAAVVILLASGCGGGGQGEDDEASQQTSAASDAGGGSEATGSSDGGGQGPSDGGSAGDEALAVTPPAQEPELTDACTGEGAYLASKDTKVDPSVPERDGLTLDVRAKGIEKDGADLVADIDGTRTPIETAHVGDTVTVDQWTLSITSVCADRVEFDVID